MEQKIALVGGMGYSDGSLLLLVTKEQMPLMGAAGELAGEKKILKWRHW